MRNHGIYISCPQQTPFDEVLIYQKLIKAEGNFDVKFWNKISYNPNLMNECDSFAIMLPNNKWTYDIDDLPSGCKKEVLNAIEEFHELLLCYKSQQGYNIYKAEINNGIISGIPGTSDVLNQKKIEIQESIGAYGGTGKSIQIHTSDIDQHVFNSLHAKSITPTTNPDSRLLLLM